MPRYVIELAPHNARRLERWLGGELEIGPVGDPGAASVADIQAITDDEYEPIRERVATEGSRYHHGGADAAAQAKAQPPVHHGPTPHRPPV